MSKRHRPKGKSENAGIVVEQRANLPSDAVRALKQLTIELAGIVGGDSTAYLRRIVVVPPGEVGSVVIDSDGQVGRKAFTAARPEPTMAFATHIENDAGLHCFIVLDSQLVRPMTLPRYHFVESVSLLLEELLHISIFTVRWRQGPHLERYEPGCASHLLSCAAKIHDEYVVARRKATILSSTPLIASSSGGLITAVCKYTIPLGPILDDASRRIEDTLLGARSGRLPTGSAWEELVAVMRELVFDPLARDAGYRAGNVSDAEVRENQPHRSTFFQGVIGPHYWPAVRSELERSSTSGLDEMDRALASIAGILAQMLHDMGVTFRQVPDGGWWIQF